MPEQNASQSGPPSRSPPVDRDSIAPSLSTPEVSQAAQAGQITPALVAEVTEKVYRLLLADLRLERERRR